MERLPQEIFQSLDHTNTKRFILAHAASLRTRGFLSAADSKIVQTVITSWDREPLLDLYEKKPELIWYIEKIWDSDRFFINQFKFSTFKIVADFTVNLKDFINQLQKKSELFFNQYFSFKVSEAQTSRRLMSEFLTEFAERLVQHHHVFTDLCTSLCFFETSVLASHDQDFLDLETELASSLDMRIQNKSVFSSNKNLIKKIVIAFQSMTDDIKSAFDFFSSSLRDQKNAGELGIKLSWTQAEISVLQQIFAMSEDQRDFRVREIQRIEATFNIFSATEFLKRVLSQFTSSLSTSNVMVIKDLSAIDDSTLELWLTTTVLKNGASCTEAQEAIAILNLYCRKNDSKIMQLLPAELKKIHPIFTEKTHELVAYFEQNEFRKKAESILKNNLLKRAAEIVKFFALVLLIASCGLKTPVHSSEKELRPEIPFRAEKVITKKPIENRNEIKK